MEVEIKIDKAYPNPKVLILTDTIKEEVNEMVKKINAGLTENR